MPTIAFTWTKPQMTWLPDILNFGPLVIAKTNMMQRERRFAAAIAKLEARAAGAVSSEAAGVAGGACVLPETAPGVGYTGTGRLFDGMTNLTSTSINPTGAF